jgi:hypothetical protein
MHHDVKWTQFFPVLVSKELNHLAAILHVYAGGLIFMNQKKNNVIFQKKMEILLHF